MKESMLSTLEFCIKNADSSIMFNKLNSSLEHLQEISYMQSLLADDESKETLSKVMCFRLAHSFLDPEKACTFFSLFSQYTQQKLIYQSQHTDIFKDTYRNDIIETFLLEGYSYKDICKAELGDVIINGGAFTGSTSLYFSNKVKDKGLVYSFEPSEETLVRLQKNIEQQGLKNVHCVNKALSDTDKEVFFDTSNTPGSRIRESGNNVIQATSIDNFAKSIKKKIDFIKLDIEGAEYEAIVGATETIKRDLPKLAICIYHKENDIFELFNLIYSISSNYRFYIRHNAFSLTDTVLFCHPAKTLQAENGSIQHIEMVELSAKIKQEFEQIKKRFFSVFFDKINIEMQKSVCSQTKSSNNWYYLPFSKDTRYHYEFVLCSRKEIQIALHFENKNEITTRIFNSIKNNLEKITENFPFNLYTKEDYRFAIFFDFPIDDINKYNYTLFAKCMLLLIDKTLPYIVKELPLSEPFLEYYMDYCAKITEKS